MEFHMYVKLNMVTNFVAGFLQFVYLFKTYLFQKSDLICIKIKRFWWSILSPFAIRIWSVVGLLSTPGLYDPTTRVMVTWRGTQRNFRPLSRFTTIVLKYFLKRRCQIL